MSQFHRPHGVGGRLAGWVMAHRSSNVERNRWVASLLEVQPTDRVLEIGFGPGIAVEALIPRLPQGEIVGVDHSAAMVRRARRRNAAAVDAGRVDLRLGSAESLPDVGGPLDTVFAVNLMGFWGDPVTLLTQLRQRLRPGGTIAIASQPRGPGATNTTSAQAGREIEAVLEVAGFTHLHIEILELKPPAVCVIGRAPSNHPASPSPQ